MEENVWRKARSAIAMYETIFGAHHVPSRPHENHGVEMLRESFAAVGLGESHSVKHALAPCAHGSESFR